MDRTKRKINVIGKICRILATIFLVLMMISATMLLITGIALVIVPDSALSAKTEGVATVTVEGKWVEKIPQEQVEKLSQSLKEGSAKITLDFGKVNDAEKKENAIVLHVDGAAADFTLRRVGLMLLAYSAIPGCLIYVFFALRHLMKELETCESPFCDGVVRGMTRFAISLIPFAALKPAAESLGKQLLMSNDIRFDFAFDLSTAFTVLVILLLILIFKYGVALQKESDETL